MIEIFALIFRGRGEHGFGDTFGLLAWAFFTVLQLNNHGHTASLEQAGADFLVVGALFTLGARPGWSRKCWPAWQLPGAADPAIRDEATRASILRGMWFLPLMIYVGFRGEHWLGAPWLIAAMPIGFALIMRWNDEVRRWARIPDAQIWCVGELMLGAWLGFIQWGLSL